MIMLFRFAIAAIASVSNIQAAHGSGGFIRRVEVESADGSNVDPPPAAAAETKLGKANKEDVAVIDDDALNLSDAEASLLESIDIAQPGKLHPEPRFFSTEEAWNHGTTSVTSAYDGTIKFYAPEDTEVGDTLFLFLHRTDGYLPLRIDDDWIRGAEVSHSKSIDRFIASSNTHISLQCFKSFNRQNACLTAAHCKKREGPYCLEFDQEQGGGDGKDLGTVVFYHHVRAEDPGCWTVELPGKSTVWAIVTAIPAVNKDRPIFRKQGTSCDNEWESSFPAVYGKKNDVLLLSQSFDDTALKRHFQPPESTDLLGFTNSFDEVRIATSIMFFSISFYKAILWL